MTLSCPLTQCFATITNEQGHYKHSCPEITKGKGKPNKTTKHSGGTVES